MHGPTNQNTTPENTPAESQPQSDQAATPAEEKPACQPAGFEEFDLDDIEVIESKVFA